MSDKGNARKVQAALPGMSYQLALQTVREALPRAEALRLAEPGTPLSVLIVRCAIDIAKTRGGR